MEMIDLINGLIRIKTETGNLVEMEECFALIENYLQGSGAKLQICRYDGVSPVLFATNCDGEDFDALVIGHIDVVPAEEQMFEPFVKNGKLYGRGALDMKSFAAVALHSLKYVLDKKLPIKFGVILSTDEEKGSKSTDAFMAAHQALSARVVLDNDVGGDITKIVLRCKNPVFVKIETLGEAAHGSTPWDGIDANEKLFQVWNNVRKFYPAYSKELKKPDDTWIDTVHFATINGGKVSNIIADKAEALLDFRLTENSTVEELCNNLDKCMVEGATYRIVSQSTPVVMSENNPTILDYKKLAEEVLGRNIEFEYIGGATDSRAFAERGSTVVMHSGTGEGMHAVGEYVELESVEQIANIQCRFLEKLASEKC